MEIIKANFELPGGRILTSLVSAWTIGQARGQARAMAVSLGARLVNVEG
jgi:hypothetical protein